MKTLNAVVWYTGYVVSMIMAGAIFLYFWDYEDLYIQIPVVIGAFGTVVLICLKDSGKSDLGMPEVTDYPVPFTGLSKMVGYQIVKLGKAGLVMLGACIVAMEHGVVVAVIIGLITVPIGLFMLMMAVCIVPFSLISDGLFLLSAFVAKSIDMSQYESNTRRFICPECGKLSPRPTYDAAGKLIKGLSPSEKGIFHVEMEHSKVPCFGSKGKRKDVPQYCPDCGASVYTREGKPWVLTMAGAPGSGKTSFIMSASGRAIGTSCGGKATSVKFYYSRDDALLSGYHAGTCRPTPEDFTPPRILRIESGRPTQRLIYMSDVSGNYFLPTGSEMDLQPQYAYNDAIVFTLDPTRPSPESTAYDAYVGFLEKYRQYNRMDASRKIAVPLAVVITRADKAGPFSGVSEDDLPGKLSENGYFKLVNSIGKDFSLARYFSCDVSKETGSTDAVMSFLCERSGFDGKGFF
ncbi:MAG: hypothetical protein IKP53_05895 [Candidatus Methanomethylophilaceae archaeon]|nr:hypothetical protein [Candidatus Methanomethylophilaceae archaeon]